jgi:hypothetical protein
MFNAKINELYNANDVINSNDLRKRIINVDSRFRATNSPSTTNFSYSCNHTYKNVIRLRLASVELPNMFPVFSSSRGNLTFKIRAYDILGIPREVKITIESGNYNSQDLLNVIQNQLDINFKQQYGIFMNISVSPYNALVTITHAGVAATPITGSTVPTNSARPFVLDFASENPLVMNRVHNFGLGYNLGFRKKTYAVSNSVSVDGIDTMKITSEGCLDIVGDTYLLLCINDYHTVEQKTTDDYIQCLAKIVIREDKYAVAYEDGSSFLSNEIIFPSPVDINILNVKLLDMYGEVVDLCGMNFALSLEITEVLNTTLYEFYRNYLWLGTIPSVPYRSVTGSAQSLLRGIGPPF